MDFFAVARGGDLPQIRERLANTLPTGFEQ